MGRERSGVWAAALVAALFGVSCASDDASDGSDTADVGDTGALDTGALDTGRGGDTDSDVGGADSGGGDTDVCLGGECSDVNDGDTDGDDADGDTPWSPPTLRDVRVTISGSIAAELDLNSDDRRLIAPEVLTATFSVIATDSDTAPNDLVVELLDALDSVLETSERTFGSGVWTVGAEIAPGESLRVRVLDSDGQESATSAALVIPTLEEAISGEWEHRQYSAAGTLLGSDDVQFGDDGTWAFTGDVEGSGTWAVEDGAVATDFGAPEGLTRRSIAYVDDVYLDPDPFSIDGVRVGWQGRWTRLVYEAPSDGSSEGDQLSESLVLGGDGTYSYERGTVEDGDGLEVAYVERGTWMQVPNESYTDTVGDFLVRTRTEINGEVVEAEEIVELGRVRGGRLLLAPLIRAE